MVPVNSIMTYQSKPGEAFVVTETHTVQFLFKIIIFIIKR